MQSSTSATPYSQIVAQTQRGHRLFSVLWEITYRCNQRCSHCYLEVLPPGASPSEKGGELATDECLRVVDELAEMGALNLTLSGGEILARRDLFTIAQYARVRRFLLRLFTNGTLIDPPAADRLAGLHPYMVEVSVYGAEAEGHDAITGCGGSFQRTVNALRLLHERGVRTKMKTPLMRENFRQIERLEALAGEVGAIFACDTTITPGDDGDCSPLERRLTYDDLLSLYRRTLNPKHWVKRSVPPDSCACAIGTNTLAIDPCGQVFPCVQLRLPAGNLRHRSLRHIWEESPLWSELRRQTTNELDVCRTCDLRSLCVRCHGLARLEDGDMWGPSGAKCREALARRQVLVEKGALWQDYPVPAHLRTMVDGLPPSAGGANRPAAPGD